MINYEGFYASLDIMWKAMAALFLFSIFVMAIITVMQIILRKREASKNKPEA